MSGNLLKEKYLLFRAKSKDPDAFAQLYDLYAERIYRFIFFKVSSVEEAQDLTSEVFLKTWQYILDGKEIEHLHALFYKVARNTVIDHYRRQAIRKDVSLDETISAEDITEQGIAEEATIRAVELTLDMDTVRDKLRDLKDEYKDVIILRYMDELSVNEIAEILGKKPGAVRVLLYRALTTLKSLLEASAGEVRTTHE